MLKKHFLHNWSLWLAILLLLFLPLKVKIRLKYDGDTMPWCPGSAWRHGVIEYFTESGLIILDSGWADLVQSNWVGETCKAIFQGKDSGSLSWGVGFISVLLKDVWSPIPYALNKGMQHFPIKIENTQAGFMRHRKIEWEPFSPWSSAHIHSNTQNICP